MLVSGNVQSSPDIQDCIYSFVPLEFPSEPVPPFLLNVIFMGVPPSLIQVLPDWAYPSSHINDASPPGHDAFWGHTKHSVPDRYVPRSQSVSEVDA